MSERPGPHTEAHAGESTAGSHNADDHGDDGGHDERSHGGDALGPIDLPKWTAAAVGVLLGLVVVLALMQSAA